MTSDETFVDQGRNEKYIFCRIITIRTVLTNIFTPSKLKPVKILSTQAFNFVTIPVLSLL